MKTIVFFCIPAYGHTNPTLEVVRELVSRGNEVVYYSYNEFKPLIEAVGAKFISLDECNLEKELSPEDTVRLGKDIVFSTKLLVDTTLAVDDKIMKDMERLKPDCIVADSMAVWGRLIAKKLAIPFVSSTTTFAFNKESAKIMKGSLKDAFKMILGVPKMNKYIQKLKDKGYKIDSFLDLIKNDENTNTIVYTSEQFQPCAETFSNKFAFVGPSIRQKDNTIQLNICKEREKLIYISMGTVNNDLVSFYKKCIEQLKNTSYDVIMSVGNKVDIDSLGNLPKNIKVYNKVDQLAVLELADVFVTHCGMNSVNEALYYEVPLVMYPKTSEQQGVANRVMQLEAGVMLGSEDKLVEGIKEVLDNKKYKANVIKISQGFKACSGPTGAADKILECI